MIELGKATPRHTLFFAFNVTVAIFLAFFVAIPILSHFASRAEDIAESATQLSHFKSIAINAKNLTKTSAQAGDPFLPGNEERVVSADLQASLKGIVATADVRFLSIRALPTVRSQQLRLVAVSMELEGPLAAIRSVILAIENQMPFLFVSAASLRSASDGEDGLIRAELKVQGAMQDKAPPSSAAEAASR
jgi:general secretion pathway protein M